jgi:hypothetical protein
MGIEPTSEAWEASILRLKSFRVLADRRCQSVHWLRSEIPTVEFGNIIVPFPFLPCFCIPSRERKSLRRNIPDTLLLGGHQCDCALEITYTTLGNCHTGVIVVISESVLSAPHGECATSAQPVITNRGNVEIGVGRKSDSVFPIACKIQSSNGVGRSLARDGRKGSIKDRILDDFVADTVVLVPASFPMSDDGRWPVLANQVTDRKLCFLIYRDFTVGIVKE